MTFVAVVVAGAVGALVRFAVQRVLDGRVERHQWYALMVVNVVGSAVLGAIVALVDERAFSAHALLIAGTGFCGALTTFSTFSLAVARTAVSSVRIAAGRVAVMVTACAFAAAAGAALAGVR